jgi:hypothetical protein
MHYIERFLEERIQEWLFKGKIITIFGPRQMGSVVSRNELANRLHTGRNPNRWFWRTHDKKEIDYLEESGGRFRAFEFKWGKGGIRSSVRDRFLKDYPDTEFSIINRENYFEIYG